MREVKIDKLELLNVVKNNREEHRKIYKELVEAYKKKITAELEARLSDLKQNKKIDLHFNVPEPKDQTKDYDRVIKMLEMSTEEVILLSAAEFSQYVQDDWAWKSALKTTAQFFNVNSDAFVGD